MWQLVSSSARCLHEGKGQGQAMHISVHLHILYSISIWHLLMELCTSSAWYGCCSSNPGLDGLQFSLLACLIQGVGLPKDGGIAADSFTIQELGSSAPACLATESPHIKL